ncbi:Solute carrier family 41 member 1 [Grifola frondosa]|uniref:Solute carrier family 41 member 1 n=1 Tax=Grifola frondosa TaxID=5627 RepID=A0A1C7MF51_GRIFR|nr:Solute carrier family 41 member 1 [Grifola frondosa]
MDSALLSDTRLDSDSSSDTVEMSNLQEIAVTPNHNNYGHGPYHHDSDDEFIDEDEGNTALLGSRSRTRGSERSTPRYLRLWNEVKRIVIETAPTLLLTTVGLLFTGEMMNNVQHWPAMARIDELIIIIPVVLNLKGNLEMNLSARLGTAANMGELDKPETRRAIILGNLTLLQVQATVVSFVAACVAFVLSRIMPRPSEEEAMAVPRYISRALHSAKPHRPRPPIDAPPSGLAEFVMVASSAMCSACISSILLGSFMCTLIVLCRRFGLDPDNIAPPVAACLGDLVTLSLLGVISMLHLYVLSTPVPFIIIVFLVIAAVGWAVVTNRNEHVRHLLMEGWVPLFVAMVISSGTGLVLDTFVSRYEGFALLAVVITGLAGGVGSIFVSRLSTALHAATASISDLTPSVYDLQEKPRHPSPRVVMITLILVSLPIEIIFLATVHAFGWLHLPFIFIALQVLFFCIAVILSLLIAQIATNLLWGWNFDPDMYALPFQSALTDLFGQLLLVACYEAASMLGAQYWLQYLCSFDVAAALSSTKKNCIREDTNISTNSTKSTA